MMKCDCDERIGTKINSYQLFQELKSFFEKQLADGVFMEVPVELPYFCGYAFCGSTTPPEGVKEECKWYADKWYKCKCCGCLWEMKYPDFPAKGFVRKFPDGKYFLQEITRGHQ